MVVKAFPDVTTADEHGLLAIGGDTERETLLLAYASGIFPWPIYPEYLTWFAPPERCLLFTSNVHISKSLKKFKSQSTFTITTNSRFEEVMERCAEPINRRGQAGTWITPEIKQGYLELFNSGNAYSIECMHGNNLVGGLYGVTIGGMVTGESMFFREPNASKLCLYHLTELLKEKNIPWIDCQVLTPLLQKFGAQTVPRDAFMKLLQKQLGAGTLFHI